VTSFRVICVSVEVDFKYKRPPFYVNALGVLKVIVVKVSVIEELTA
jgi:hypothetical protein